eukprot:TRINITY_DN22731_c0_g2_i2.p2 TRINITY_DN22731_c0_g2~~TRINITY_DN22731_c0_g2_i2.p2  ORF type:complete len:926 (+),score=169.88 TRINITY_DN22731_c0_g2_i2:310-2778(+)
MAPDTRQIAGLVLKNTLASRDARLRKQYQDKWDAVDPQVKETLHGLFLETLNDANLEIAKTAALCIGKIGAVDIMRSQWKDLFTLLCQKAMNGTTVGQKAAAMEAIGYLFEDFGEGFSVPQEGVNNVLTAVVGNFMGQGVEEQLRLAAINALQYVLEFAEINFEQDTERQILMQVIMESCTYSSNQQIQVSGFECLIKVAQAYYEKLPQYISHIYKITFEAAQTADEDVALQAIEFWSALSEEEYDREQLITDGENYQLFNMVSQASPQLVQLLTQLLLKQEEGQEEDPHEWNISISAATCLALMAQVTKDKAVDLTMPFIQANIGNPDDWRKREAATVAFGAIMEGPSSTALMKVSKEALNFLLNALNDSNPAVKSTTAWTIGRLFEFVHSQSGGAGLVTNNNLNSIVSQLLSGLNEEPFIADKICYAFSWLAKGFKGQQPSLLAPYYQDILQALYQVTERQVSQDSAVLHLAGYDAIISMVESSSHETMAAVAQMVPTLLMKLHNSVEIQKASENDQQVIEEQSIIQGSVCGLLQEIILKMSRSEASKTFLESHSDNIMKVLLEVLGSRQKSIHEEAMLAVGAMCFYSGSKFTKYLDAVMNPYIMKGIENHYEWQAANITIGVFGDICQQVGSEVNKYCNDVMQLLMLELQSNEVNRNLKSVILSVLGSVAFGIGNEFVRFVQPVVSVLNGAIQLSVYEQSHNENFVEQNNELRIGILEAISGMLQGLSKNHVNEMLGNFIPIVVDYIRVIESDKEKDLKVVRTAVGVLGDIAMTVTNCGNYFQGTNAKWIEDLLKGAQVDVPDTAQWAAEQIQQVVQKA